MSTHQNLNKSTPDIYPGSIERVDFSEEKEDKGFVMIELGEAVPSGNSVSPSPNLAQLRWMCLALVKGLKKTSKMPWCG